MAFERVVFRMLPDRQTQKVYPFHLSLEGMESVLLCRCDEDYDHLEKSFYLAALAYVPRNALDAGCRVEDSRWSGYRGMFVDGRCPPGGKIVAEMGTRERNNLFHTHEDLSRVPWIVNAEGQVEPASACDYRYLESAFAYDQAFFLKSIGSVNVAEMYQKLSLSGKLKQSDSQLSAIVNDWAARWFNSPVNELTLEKKARLLPYLYRT